MFNIYFVSAGPLVGHTAVEEPFWYSVKYQVIVSSLKYKYKYQVSGV